MYLVSIETVRSLLEVSHHFTVSSILGLGDLPPVLNSTDPGLEK
jgi:hypothetical protein